METYDTIRAVLGWSSVINLGLLVVAAIAVAAAGGPIKRIHSSLYHLPDADLDRMYFQYMANFKALILVFNVVPYLAMRIVA